MQCRNLTTRPLRVALVGCGRWGSCIATTIEALPEYELAWVCDPQVRWSNVSWAPELTDEVCRDVEAVLIATPAESHFKPAVQALLHERAVFVEKPFTLSAQEALHIAAHTKGATLMVGHLLVFHPLYERLLRQLGDSRLGTIRHIQVKRHSPARGNTRCPWWTLAPHDLSLLVRLLGKPKEMHVAFAPNGRDVHAELVWKEASAHLDYSTTSDNKHRTWRLETTSATLELDEGQNAWTQSGSNRVTLASEPSPLALELRHFANCVANGERPTTGIEDALTNVELLCWGQRLLTRTQRYASSETAQGSVL